MTDQLKKTVADGKDAAHELEHRTKAELERAKRDVAGDEMTTGEKVKSFVHEDVERTKADMDEAKRKLRDKT
ncbi:MAG TPA: hypothetical protein VKT51_03485 [Candidatus Eremiobacteraceae bacterium]|nr:hypothetical protein [Candidatus Eremiobacteraceae bacterium]